MSGEKGGDVKVISTVLDSLPSGEQLPDLYDNKPALPEGISSGRLYKDVVRIAWPSFVELTLTQLTAMFDLMMVGGLTGTWALTSVGLATQPKFLMLMAFMALSVGATAMIARARGAGDRERARLMFRQALVMTFALSVVLSVVGYFLSEDLIRFMGASTPESLAGGTTYLQVQMVGLPVIAVTAVISAALRGVGNSRTAMYYNLTANVVNVVLNWLLIEGRLGFPRLEVFGASLATVIGQCVALLLAIYSITRKDQYLCVSIGDSFKPNKEALRGIFKVGAPSMVEQIVLRLGLILFVQIVYSLGDDAAATHTVCMSILALSFMSGQAFATSSTSLVGQSLGKKRPDMAQFYSTRAQRCGLVFALFMAVVFILFGQEIVGLYNSDPYVLEHGAQVMILMAFIQPLQGSQLILAGALRGAGDTRSTAVIMLITVLLVRPILAWVLVNIFEVGLMGAWAAIAFDQTLRSLLVWRRYRSGKWKHILK